MSAVLPKSSLHPPPKSMRAEQKFSFTELFTPHGFWAPGVKFFRVIGFRAKALLISATFVAPIALLFYLFLTVKQDIITVANNERVGVVYLKELVPTLKAAQLSRHAATSAVAGKPFPNADAIERQLTDQQAKLGEIEKRLGKELGTTAAFSAYQAASESARNARGSYESVFAAHSNAINALVKVGDAVLDGSGLSLDPQLETYYLMDAAAVRSVNLVILMARMRSAGMSLLQLGPDATPEEKRWALNTINQSHPLAIYHSIGFQAGIDKAESSRKELKAEMQTSSASDSMRQFLEVVKSNFMSESAPTISASSYLSSANAAIDSQFDLNARVLVTLDRLLAERAADAAKERNLSILVIVLFLALAAYMFCTFYMVTSGGLKEIERHLQVMTSGDLTTTPEPWGKDEASTVMHSLADMQHSLRTLVSEVQGSAESMLRASQEIASASTDLSARTENTAANLEESAASIEQVAATVRNTADNAGQAAQLANTNTSTAETGGEVIGRVVNTMEAINASSTKISDIIGTIDGIAFQTNILALNAAVEAARAGEQGRGFAVVAAEVRSLAQRSADAAKEIKVLISSSVDQVREGTTVVQTAGDTMSEIVNSAKRVNDLLSEISTAAKEQSTGIAQVSSSVQELDRMTQQNAALVEETAAAASSLSDQANGLFQQVGRFKLP
ncbi:MAG: methyl-accepting chemotaxis protein [Nitrosomonadaceae bacterium]|nr:methyl-accepting chemotaxis protein [Nitrosomonadaceae bacterium]